MRLLPDRGLDIGAAWFRGTPLAWISQVGEQGAPDPADLVDRAWVESWCGGLVTTCGLSNVGEASEGHGLHGTYTARAATEVAVERSTSEVTATATVVDPPFTLARRIVTTAGQGLVRLDDRVSNGSEWTAAAPLLYHVNFGAPLWDDGTYLETDAQDVVPRDEDAAAGLATWDEPPDSGARGPRTRLRARGRIVGAADERPTRARGDRTLVTPTPLAMGPPRGGRPMRSPSSRRTARCWGVPTTSPRAKCRSSTRARLAPPGSRSKRGPCDCGGRSVRGCRAANWR